MPNANLFGRGAPPARQVPNAHLFSGGDGNDLDDQSNELGAQNDQFTEVAFVEDSQINEGPIGTSSAGNQFSEEKFNDNTDNMATPGNLSNTTAT